MFSFLFTYVHRNLNKQCVIKTCILKAQKLPQRYINVYLTSVSFACCFLSRLRSVLLSLLRFRCLVLEVVSTTSSSSISPSSTSPSSSSAADILSLVSTVVDTADKYQ